MKILFFLIILAYVVATAFGIVLAATPVGPEERTIRIGYDESPMLAAIYLAKDHGILEQSGAIYEPKEFGSTTDVGYALIARQLDAGFLDPENAVNLLKADNTRQIKIAGAVTFPYGASLIVRKDLDIRLNDLEGMVVAAEEPGCGLLKQFVHDALRYGVNTSNITFVYIGFDEMLPAMESGKIDAAVCGTSLALIAESEGHKTLYQNWEVAEKDECCPAYLRNLEYFLLVRGLDRNAVNELNEIFEAQNNRTNDERVRAVKNNTGFPERPLYKYPATTYLPAGALGDDTRTELEQWIWT
jgi:ABC-type nitrate/sulfonate/bicarbonate transport system substrate-binding protein